MERTASFLSGLLVGVVSALLLPGAVEWLADRAHAPTGLPAGEGQPGVGPPRLAEAPGMRDREVAKQILEGGFILHFRHGNRQKWDSVIAFDVLELATRVDAAQTSYRDAVCLSPQGVEEGKAIGEVFRLAGAGISTVLASPSCRAQQTAMLAFGKIDATVQSLAHTPVVNSDNRQAFAEQLARTYREVPVSPDANVAVVAHGNTLENHPDLFAKGAEKLGNPPLLETGFYVIRRRADGALELVHTYLSLGEFAAAAITLSESD